MTQPQLKLPKPSVGKEHPFLNTPNHEKLIEYVRERLLAGKEARNARLDRLCQIDKAVAGWQLLSAADRERAEATRNTGTPHAITVNLPLTYVHTDDMMTYYAQTFAPTRGMFYHSGSPEDVESSNIIVEIMNSHAIYGGYYTQILRTLQTLLRYNYGGFHCYWHNELPALVTVGAIPNEPKWQGNRLDALDVYNLLIDPTVPFTNLHSHGEFGGWAEMVSHYRLQLAAARGEYYNCQEALDSGEAYSTCTYYVKPPTQAQMDADESGGTDWKSILSGGNSSAAVGYELVHVYIRLVPTEFGLVAKTDATRQRYELWKLTILNDKHIIAATYQDNMHEQIPLYLGAINDDLMESSTKSIAEILSPLQQFASFLLNTHIAATRKQIWDLTIYDSSVVDLTQVPDGEVAARIPTRATAAGKDLRTAIWQPQKQLETKQTLSDLEGVIGIIDQFFPTQSLPSQIAGIDRAVDSQVAAVQQGANRRQQKTARLLDDSLFRLVRSCLYYNIIQFMPNGATVNNMFTGKSYTIDSATLKDTDLPYIIGQGLKALDRQAAVSMLQQIIFALIQAPAAAAEIDLLGLIDYWTSMMDIDVDLKARFKKQVTQAVGPDGQPTAEAPPPVEGGNQIAPATNPAALTTPIYG
jgi:hypothetical protein